MNDEVKIKILGKTYNIKCQTTSAKELEQSAIYLEKMMREFNEKNKNKNNLEAPAIVTALNLAHEVLTLKNRLQQLLRKITTSQSVAAPSADL